MDVPILFAVLAVFLAGILFVARRAAKKGRRYIGTEDAVERYLDIANSGPWTGGSGWRARVKMQAWREAARRVRKGLGR